MSPGSDEHPRSKSVLACHSERSEESLSGKRDSSLRSEWQIDTDLSRECSPGRRNAHYRFYSV